jgi:hypothetical protein
MEYIHAGHVFEYDTMRLERTNRWLANGHLISNPNVEKRTNPFEKEEDAVKEFMDWAMEWARQRRQP